MDTSQENNKEAKENDKNYKLREYLEQIKITAKKHSELFDDNKAKLSNALECNQKLMAILQNTFMYSTYRYLNPDLGSLDDPSLLDHFISHGFEEGRKCDEEAAKQVQATKYKYQQSRAIQELSRFYLSKKNSEHEDKKANKIEEIKPKKTISKTIGTRLSLEENKDFDFAIKHTLYDPKTKCLASFIPKNGCTNLRYSFAVANNLISSPEDIDWVHSNNQSMNANLESIQNSDYSFVILRNPYERLASAFWNKFLDNSEEDLIDQSGEIFRNLLNKNNSRNEINSFKDFVNNLWEDPLLISKDTHLRYQTDFLLLSNYDNYFSLNDFQHLQEELLERVNLKIIDTRNFAKHTTFGCEQKSDRYYGSCTIEELTEIKDQKMAIKYNNFYDEEDAYKTTILYYNDIIAYIEKTGDLDSAKDYLRKGLIYSTQYQI